MICFLISVILMISSYFLMISFIYSVLTNIIIDFHGNHVIINLTNSNLITKQAWHCRESGVCHFKEQGPACMPCSLTLWGFRTKCSFTYVCLLSQEEDFETETTGPAPCGDGDRSSGHQLHHVLSRDAVPGRSCPSDDCRQ